MWNDDLVDEILFHTTSINNLKSTSPWLRCLVYEKNHEQFILQSSIYPFLSLLLDSQSGRTEALDTQSIGLLSW